MSGVAISVPSTGSSGKPRWSAQLVLLWDARNVLLPGLVLDLGQLMTVEFTAGRELGAFPDEARARARVTLPQLGDLRVVARLVKHQAGWAVEPELGET